MPIAGEAPVAARVPATVDVPLPAHVRSSTRGAATQLCARRRGHAACIGQLPARVDVQPVAVTSIDWKSVHLAGHC